MKKSHRIVRLIQTIFFIVFIMKMYRRTQDWHVLAFFGVLIMLEFIFVFMWNREKELEEKRHEEELRNLRLQVLTGQVRPHFILNTLGAIRSLIPQDAGQASELLYDFSRYIRKHMEEKDYSKPIPFLEELDYIETYLRLEKLRFHEKLQVEYDIREKSFWILPLSVQPFVENAVKHGLLGKAEGGTIWISTYKEEGKIVIEIRDDGVGFDTKKLWKDFEKKKNVGIKSAIYRLKNELGAVCTVISSTRKNESGTKIQIQLSNNGERKYENNNCR